MSEITAEINVSAKLPDDHPLVLTFASYKSTDDYANTRHWALYEDSVDGSLWAAFSRGYAYRNALAAQLNRAREWMRHKPECCAPKAGERDCCCGLRDFLKELDHE